MTATGDAHAIECATPDTPALVVRTGFVPFVARSLLFMIVPLCLVWIPVGNVPGAGNVTASDVALIVLWCLTGWELLLGGISDVDLATTGMVLLAVLIAVLAGIGAELSGGGGGAFEFAVSMKRFGLASVLPIAAQVFRSPRLRASMRAASVVSIAALAAFTVIPALQDHLLRPDTWDADAIGGRATGLAMNPNDLGYAAIGLIALHGALLPINPGVADRMLLAGALGGAAIPLVASASRSSLLGASGAVAFLLVSSTLRRTTKLALAVSAAALVIIGLSSSSVFEERVARAFSEGFAEENVSSRLQLQRIAAETWVEHPLGVGYSHFAEASSRVGAHYRLEGSDSVYFDTLLGAGLFGLLSLLSLFRIAWTHVARSARNGERRAAILGAGLIAFFLFGTASVIPMAVLLSPIFFSLAAAADCGGGDGDGPRSCGRAGS